MVYECEFSRYNDKYNHIGHRKGFGSSSKLSKDLVAIWKVVQKGGTINHVSEKIV
jgi:hypothetical protein